MDLRANTAVDVLIGPFVDNTDGNTTEDGLTLTAAEIKLSKNGQALTLKSDVTSAAFDDDGYYNCELDATDTNTEGNLVLIVHQSANALPVRHEYNVLSEAAYDSLYVAKDTGFMDVNVKEFLDDAQSATDLKDFADAGYDPATNKVQGVVLVDTTTTNTDMRGTDSAALASAYTAARAAFLDNINGHTAQTGDTFAKFAGITLLAEWLGLLAGKQAGDATALTEIKATGDGSGTYDPTTDSVEALRDSLALASALATAQLDLDTITGADGVNLLSGTQASIDTIETDTTTDIPALIAALNDPTAATVAAAVWDAVQSSHVTVGSFGIIASEIAAILVDTDTTIPALIAALNDISAANVLTQVNAALDTAIAELGVGQPSATPSLRTGLMLLYMKLAQRLDTQTSGTDALEIYDSAGTLIAKKLLTDDGADYSEARAVSG
jgi:hypothetical protein